MAVLCIACDTPPGLNLGAPGRRCLHPKERGDPSGARDPDHPRNNRGRRKALPAPPAAQAHASVSGEGRDRARIEVGEDVGRVVIDLDGTRFAQFG